MVEERPTLTAVLADLVPLRPVPGPDYLEDVTEPRLREFRQRAPSECS
jgi:hypothetical protein